MTRGFIRFLTGASMIVLVAGCAKVAEINDVQTAVDKTATAITAIKSTTSTAASRNAAVQCAAQAVANAAADMFTQTGHSSAKDAATQLSAWFGAGCV